MTELEKEFNNVFAFTKKKCFSFFFALTLIIQKEDNYMYINNQFLFEEKLDYFN